jgi:DNA-binding response OmpR family regulator
MSDQHEARSAAACQVLLIEEDEAYRAVVEACVRLAGCRVDWAPSPGLALPMLERQRFDLVIWGVSTLHGDRRGEVIPEFRLGTEAPLIVLDDVSQNARLDLEAGADQWLHKPFAPGALLGSIRAALRKPAASIIDAASHVEIQGMVLDGRRRNLAFDGQDVAFTRQEWGLLSILVSHPNRFLGSREIIRLGWQVGGHAPEQLRTYVRRLRNKFEPLDLPCRLLSQHGQGYSLVFPLPLAS